MHAVCLCKSTTKFNNGETWIKIRHSCAHGGGIKDGLSRHSLNTKEDIFEVGEDASNKSHSLYLLLERKSEAFSIKRKPKALTTKLYGANLHESFLFFKCV